MDIIDAYYYWSEQNPENEDAAQDMITLISDLATYARDTRGMGDNFRVIPQNGEWLRWDAPDEDVQVYYNVVDGIGVEDVFYYGDLDNDNPYNPRTDEIEIIDEMIERDKVVLSVEYLTNITTIESYYETAQDRNWTPAATTRDLDQLIYYPDLLTVPESGERIELPSAIGISTWPNPFNASTTISLTLNHAGDVRIELFNTLGQRVLQFPDQAFTAGKHAVALDGSDLSTGTYLVRVSQGEDAVQSRVTLIK